MTQLLRCRDDKLSLDRVVVMGVLNVTPDSFSDGGRWLDPERAVAHGVEMVSEGAGVIDVGGESTRPGASPVDADEEKRRVLPVIARLCEELDVPVSIDTRKAAVATEALDAGASIVNDTLGEEQHDELVDAAAAAGAAFVTMHSRGTPGTMRSLTSYGDVVDDVASWLVAWTRRLEERGLESDRIVVDPGFGFAKTPEQNLALLDRLEEIVGIGYPVLAGTSRKSFIGVTLGLPEEERVEGTAATVAIAVYKGARMVRVHDVGAMTRVVRMVEAIRGKGGSE